MTIEDRAILIFPRKEGKENNLKKYAEFILLLDNLDENIEEIIRRGEKLGIEYVRLNYSANKDLVKIIEENSVSRSSLDDLSADYLDIVLYFEVYEESDHDLFIGEVLCPFVLYRSRGKMECILSIAAQDGNRDIRPFANAITRYMYYESLRKQRYWALDKGNNFIWTDEKDISDPKYANDYYNQCFTYDGKRASRLHRKLSSDNMANVIPLIKLNTSSYYILNQSVEESFGNEEEFKRLWGEYNLLEELKCKLIKDKSFFDYQQEYRVENLEDYEANLMEVLIQSICAYSLRTTWSIDNTEIEEMIYDACKHVSLLACLFFTSFFRDLKSDKSIVEDRSILIKLINLAQDYADGILQIIENAREYAEAGYMKIRIIEINKKEYISFKNRYKNYFENKDNIKYYLQIQISDVSQNDIVSSFVSNNKIDSSDSKSLLLKDFFVPLSENKGSKLDNYYKDLGNIAQHYGIRQFVSVVNTQKGYFEVISTNKYKIDQESSYSNVSGYKTEGFCLPGTEYKILFPINYELKEEQEPVGFGAEVDYKDISVINNWKCKFFDYSELVLANRCLQTVAENQMQKIEKINFLAKYISNQKKKNQILCFDVANINQMWKIEILTKAVILYIVKCNTRQRIALYNATRNFMVNFTRYICNFYDNISNCEVKKSISETQLYICKDDYSVDVGFKGKNLTDAYMVCDYLARTRGVFDDCLELINSTISRGGLAVKSNKTVKFAPFDLLVTIGNSSLFEERVKSDLWKDIQSTAFGCCLNDAHMRVGSKMHITDKFYDATLLFASGYYISRFAYLLAKKIADRFDVNSKIVLVGYENYSELLLTEIQRLLNRTFKVKNVNYIIYEQNSKNGFKFIEQNLEYTKQQYIVIVPINSTLTTHSKIEAEIHKRISAQANIVLNLAVILIRSTNGEDEEKALLVNKPRGIEKKYWTDIDTKKEL